MEHSCVLQIIFGNIFDLLIVDRIRCDVLAQQIIVLHSLVMSHDCSHLEVVPLHVSVRISREPCVLIEVVLSIRCSPRTTSTKMLLPMVPAPHEPLGNDRLAASIFLEKLSNLRLDFTGRDRSDSTLVCVVDANFIFSQLSIPIGIDCFVEWSPFVELNIILLDRGPVLPPAQLSVLVAIKVVEAPDEILFGDGCVREVTLDHHVILSHPLIVCHDSIVKKSLLDIAFAL